MELVDEGRVHGHVTLVEGDSKRSEDGEYGSAVLERPPNHAYGREVDDNGFLRARDVRLGVRVGLRYGLETTYTVAYWGWDSRGIYGGGDGREIAGEERIDVLEGGAGELG